MTINKALPGDTLDYHKKKKKGDYYKKRNNFLINKKQEHVIKLVCIIGYSCVVTLSG